MKRALLLALAAACFAASEEQPSTVDFGPRAGWTASGPITVRAGGRISLTQDGQGIIRKLVELDVDRFPVLLVRAADSLPRVRWKVMVQPARAQDSWTVLLEKYIEEGGFVVPLRQKTGWSGNVRFKLAISLEGHRGDWMEFDALEAVRFNDAPPPAPRLAAPLSGATISRPALHYCWRQAPDAVEYELQVSGRADFIGAGTVQVAPPYLADKLPYLPETGELPEAGKWYWRVRGLSIAGRPGAWSDTATFTIRQAGAPRPPELRVAPDHPLIILHADPAHLPENWRALPAELKDHVVLRVEALPTEELRLALASAQKNDIPVLIQASGPHDYYGRTSSRVTLSEIEQMFLEFPVLKGVYLCEQAFRVSPANNRIMMDYARRLVPLAASYAKLVVWADSHWGRNLWIEVGLNRSLLATFRTHRQHFIPVWKMNGSLTPFSAQGAVFGFWAGGAVENWGVQPERWYWYEAGFGKLNEQRWFKEGEMGEFPPAFYGQMLLLGLSAGASVYSLEPPSDVWSAPGTLSQVSRQVTFPLLLEMVRYRAIPSREQVLEKVRAAYVADERDVPWSLEYGAMEPVYRATYGMLHPFQMIPSTGRYFWLPVVSRWTPETALRSFPARLKADTFSSAEQARARFEKLYPETNHGQAWVMRVGDAAVVMNSRENWDEDQAFEVALSGSVSRVSGRMRVNGYVLAHPDGGELRIHVNGRPDRPHELELGATARPDQILCEPPGALAGSAWDSQSKRLRLRMPPREGAATIRIR